MAKVTFVGTGEAFDPSLPNTSSLYEGSVSLLIDCGYSVPHALWRLSTDPERLDAIYITHTHADHSFGLPALLLWMRIAGRQRPLRVVGGPGVERWLDTVLNLGYPDSFCPSKCFPIEPMELTPGRPVSLGALTLENAPSEHSIPNFALRVQDGPTSVCFSGDGIPTPQTAALYRGADLLVHECYYADENAHGHVCARQLLPLAGEWGVRRLALVHLGRDQHAPVARVAANAAPTAVVVSIPQPLDWVEV